MSRRSSNLEFSIRGDELEQHRIQLEHNLQHTDLSLHLSNPDEDYSDVEYPRHNSAPSPSFAFASFEQRSGDQFDPHEQSQYHAWSFQSFNRDETGGPYGGETLSTAAHHASALTLSAGLGGRANRRDVSLSGAEYDPDRPLQGIIAGIDSRFSVLDVDSTRSKNLTSNAVGFDPLVVDVDDTAELDRVLETGHARIPPKIRSPASSFSSSSSPSEPASPRPQSPSLRPRLSDALHAVSFSPKRPRSAQAQLPPRQRADSPSALPSVTRRVSTPPLRSSSPSFSRHCEGTTPRPSRQSHNVATSHDNYQQSLSYVDPAVNVLPPTPSVSNGSKFSRMARDLAQKIETEQHFEDGRGRGRDEPERIVAQSTDVANRAAGAAKMRQAPVQKPPLRTPLKSRIHLPDVTGLTSAIGSPARIGMEFYKYDGKDDNEGEARLFATLNAVQSKLAFLENENSISRRRVHELELELEACKQEVARERTKVLDREEVIAQRAADVIGRERERLADISRQARGKAREPRRRPDGDSSYRAANESRYKEVVEEKKALEALITTLRNHLSRLTTELAEHQHLLEDLRSLRDSDARALAEKSRDVDQLRQEVERLAGEVEVLRGVVEEGLKERRAAREQFSRELSHDGSDDERSGRSSPVQDDNAHRANTTIHAAEVSSESDEEDDVSESSGHRSPTPSRTRENLADRTTRTDYATLGSSQPPDEPSTRAFVEPEELGLIANDVQERRSERSVSQSWSSGSRDRSVSRPMSRASALSRSTSSAPSMMGSRRVSSPSVSRRSDDEGDGDKVSDDETRPATPNAQMAAPSRSRPAAPTPAHALRDQYRNTRPAPDNKASSSKARAAVEEETPFPSIRGKHMERLFFSAPEHNAETCTVCHRRRRTHHTAGEDAEPIAFWLSGTVKARKPKVRVDDEDDEGFAEGPEDDAQPQPSGKGKERESARVPQQTVLARVIRELEDDFAHYKSIYVELADQYKLMDAVSNVAKRNIVAGNLREVIDILEQKGDQIASLYDLLTFQDKPTSQSVVPDKARRPPPVDVPPREARRGSGRQGNAAAS